MATALAMIGGLVLLVLGAELLVRGAVRLAQGLGVSPLVIGLTVVGFGTSTPELVTSVQGALVGSSGIAVGNIVGSNIVNVLVILAISAVVWPLAVSSVALKRDGALVLAATLIFVALGWAWTLDRPTGLLFLLLLVSYLVYAWRQESAAGEAATDHTAGFQKAEAHDEVAGRVGGPREGSVFSRGALRWLLPLAAALAGLALLALGGRFFVNGAIELAQAIGVSDAVIGLTVVAAGTSMPELATSAVAALRRHTDVIVGNVLGSNIYNILGIGGVTAIIAPTAIPPEIVAFDNYVMLGASALLLFFLWTGRTLTRAEGLALLALYGVYVWFLWPQ